MGRMLEREIRKIMLEKETEMEKIILQKEKRNRENYIGKGAPRHRDGDARKRDVENYAGKVSRENNVRKVKGNGKSYAGKGKRANYVRKRKVKMRDAITSATVVHEELGLFKNSVANLFGVGKIKILKFCTAQ